MALKSPGKPHEPADTSKVKAPDGLLADQSFAEDRNEVEGTAVKPRETPGQPRKPAK